jgi:hypothetical protein
MVVVRTSARHAEARSRQKKSNRSRTSYEGDGKDGRYSESNLVVQGRSFRDFCPLPAVANAVNNAGSVRKLRSKIEGQTFRRAHSTCQCSSRARILAGVQVDPCRISRRLIAVYWWRHHNGILQPIFYSYHYQRVLIAGRYSSIPRPLVPVP